MKLRLKLRHCGVLLLAGAGAVAPQDAAKPIKPDSTPVVAPPALIVSCDPGGCWDENGVRYDAAGAGIFIRRDGMSCQLVKQRMSCK